MFDFAQAALLRAGVTEDKLPRTHSGIIEAFRRHAVQSGQIDRELATQLSRTESLRIKADYTGTEIELNEAKEVVQNAELFVQTVERVFGLDKPSLAKEYENPISKDDDKVSEPTVASEIGKTGANFIRGDSPSGARKLVAVAAASGQRSKKRGRLIPKMLTEAPGRIKATQVTTILMSSTVSSQSYGDPFPAMRGALGFQGNHSILRGKKAAHRINRFCVVDFLTAAIGMPVSKETSLPSCLTARASRYMSVSCRGPWIRVESTTSEFNRLTSSGQNSWISSSQAWARRSMTAWTGNGFG